VDLNSIVLAAALLLRGAVQPPWVRTPTGRPDHRGEHHRGDPC